MKCLVWDSRMFGLGMISLDSVFFFLLEGDGLCETVGHVRTPEPGLNVSGGIDFANFLLFKVP